MIDHKSFQYQGKTGIGRTKAFEKKGLGEYSVNIGNICEFGCTFCYVPSVTMKQKVVKNIIDDGLNVDEFSLYRDKTNVLKTVSSDIEKLKHLDNKTVFFCTTCDPCAIPEHMQTSSEAIKIIMEQSKLKVRVLSKSILIRRLAESLTKYNDRILYSLSTGTSLADISKAIERNASPIKARVKTLHWLQDNGFQTYGMLCPVIPSEIEKVDELLEQVRPEQCERVWVEALNVRGKSLIKTFNKLRDAGLEEHAIELKRVIGDKEEWRRYSKNLFIRFQMEMEKRGLLDKLMFLQYVSSHDKKFFQSQKGAICL